ncbi:hypothetical protein PENSPDRAFT_656497 [Peniophora sp. CONT]|nr:hypothetical protein PENSPDRAFT_656497 [Peniophora sp. CONT]
MAPSGMQQGPVPFSTTGKALPKFTAGTCSIESLRKWMHNGTLDLEADYQRDVVWNPQKQQMLIDSIFLNYHIPPLIFARTADDEGFVKRVCIDGKQRLSSIKNFMDGVICQSNPAEPKDKYWYKLKDQPGYALPRQFKNQFKQAQMTYVEFDGLDDQQQREVFRRVQLGVALNVSEKMKAETLNDKMDVVKRLSDSHRATLKQSTFNPAREADFRWISTAMYTINEKLLKRTDQASTYATYKAVQKWLGDPSAPASSHFLDDFEETVTVLIQLLTTKAWCIKVTKRPKTLAPTDLVAMIHLVFSFRTRFTLDVLGHAVMAMRERARMQFDDLRFNKACLQPYNDFLDEFKTQGTALLGLPDEDEDDELKSEPDDDEEEEDDETSEPEIVVLERGPTLSQRRAPVSSGPSSSQRTATRPVPVSSQRTAPVASPSQPTTSTSRPRPSSSAVTSQLRHMEIAPPPTKPPNSSSSRHTGQPARSLSQYIGHDSFGGSQATTGSKRPGPNIQYGSPQKRPRGG